MARLDAVIATAALDEAASRACCQEQGVYQSERVPHQLRGRLLACLREAEAAARRLSRYFNLYNAERCDSALG